MSSAGPRPNILVVDDDPPIQNMLSQVLGVEGFPFEIAKNGQEAIDILSKSPNVQRIMLLDLRMPVLDGWGVMKWLVVEHPEIRANTKVVLMSADDYLKQATDLPRDGTLTKPYGIPDLLAVLEKLA